MVRPRACLMEEHKRGHEYRQPLIEVENCRAMLLAVNLLSSLRAILDVTGDSLWPGGWLIVGRRFGHQAGPRIGDKHRRRATSWHPSLRCPARLQNGVNEKIPDQRVALDLTGFYLGLQGAAPSPLPQTDLIWPNAEPDRLFYILPLFITQNERGVPNPSFDFAADLRAI